MDVCLLWNRQAIFQDLSWAINDVHHPGEEQIRLKRQLTQNTAHELKTPVSSSRIFGNHREQWKHFARRCEHSWSDAMLKAASRLLHRHRINTYGRAANMIDMEKIDISLLVGNRKRNYPGTGRKAYHRSQLLKPKIQLRKTIPCYTPFSATWWTMPLPMQARIYASTSVVSARRNFYYFSLPTPA